MSKSKNNAKALIASIILTGGAVATIAGCVSAANTIEGQALKNELEDKVSVVTKTEEYINHTNSRKNDLYQMYKSGELTKKEYDKQLEMVDSVDYVLSSDESLVSNDDKKEISDLNERIKSCEIGSGVSLLTSIAGGTVAYASFAATMSNDEEEKIQ